MAKKKFKKPKGLKVEYPVACAMCEVMIEKPTWDTKIGAIRPHPMFNEKGKIIIVCSTCKPPRSEVKHVRS